MMRLGNRRFSLLLISACLIGGGGCWYASLPSDLERRLVGYWHVEYENGLRFGDYHFRDDGFVTFRSPPFDFNESGRHTWWCRGDTLYRFPGQLTFQDWFRHYHAMLWGKKAPAITGDVITEIDENTYQIHNALWGVPCRLKRFGTLAEVDP